MRIRRVMRMAVITAITLCGCRDVGWPSTKSGAVDADAAFDGTARVVSAKTGPDWPILQNRAAIVWFGVLVGLASGALAMLAYTLAARRRARRTPARDPSWQSDVPVDREAVPWEPTASSQGPESTEPSLAFVDVRWHAPAALDALDAYRSLCDTILGLSLDQCTVVLVAGAAAARGRKSRVAGRLALSLTQTRRPRVLLLEGDLENPRVSSTLSLEMPMSAGLSRQLEMLARGGPPQPLTVLRCSESLHVLAEGLIRSPGIVLSMLFETAVLALRRYFDVIVIDGPPARASVELHAIDGLVDVVIYADPGLDASDDAAPIAPEPAVCKLFGDKRLLVAVSA